MKNVIIDKFEYINDRGHYFNYTKEAMDLIIEVAKEMGKSYTGDYIKDFHTGGYGSNFYTIFPVKVSRLLEVSKSDAIEYIKNVFTEDRCRYE